MKALKELLDNFIELRIEIRKEMDFVKFEKRLNQIKNEMTILFPEVSSSDNSMNQQQLWIRLPRIYW